MKVVAVMRLKMNSEEWMNDAKDAVNGGGVVRSRLSSGHWLLSRRRTWYSKRRLRVGKCWVLGRCDGEESRLAGVAACVALQAQCVGAGDLYLGRIGSVKWLNAANISEALGRSED